MSSSNKTKCLIVGCSNTVGYHHAFADVLFNDNKLDCLNRYLDENYYNPLPNYDDIDREIEQDNYYIYNSGRAGAGNEYVVETANQKLKEDNFDYVFIQFTGLLRHDIKIDNEWHFSGGPSGLNAKQMPYFIDFYKNYNKKQYTDIMLSKCKSLLTYLDHTAIKYNWCFYYDTDKNASLEEHLPVKLEHSNKIVPDPHTFCYSIGKGANDGYHFMYDGYREWLYKHKEQFCLNNSYAD